MSCGRTTRRPGRSGPASPHSGEVHQHPIGRTERGMRCRLCDSDRMLSVLDLGASPPSQSFLAADELDSPEPTFPLHLRLCESCLLLQIPALITSEDTFTDYAYFSSYSDSWVQHAKK